MRPPEEPTPDRTSPEPPVQARDLEKIQEKQPIYLEPRQVFRWALLGIGGLAAAFGAGWWARGTPPPATRSGEPQACACPSAVPGPQEVPPEPEGARVVRSQVLPQPPEVTPRPPEPLALVPERRSPDEAPPLPPPARPPVPQSPPPAEAPAGLASLGPPPPPPTAEAHGAPAPGTGTPRSSDAPPSAAPASGHSAAEGPAAQGASTPSTTVPLAQRRWSVQVRAYRDPQLAQEYAATLKKRGYSARVLTGRDPEGTPWYRIHVGRFTTSAEAQRFAARFNVREGEKAIAVEGP